MTWQTGSWGKEGKARSKKRLDYFRDYTRKRNNGGIGIGFVGEREALAELDGSQMMYRNECKYDIEWRGKKIDVKTSMPSKDYGYWKFLLTRQKGIVDYFLIICKDANEKTRHMFLIPDKALMKNNLSLTKKNIHLFCKYEIKGGGNSVSKEERRR